MYSSNYLKKEVILLFGKKMFLILILVCILLIFSTSCKSQEVMKGNDNYPERNIEIVVGWGAGGGTDLFTRIISEPIKDILNTSVTIINMPGASSAEAANYVQEQPADGYTLFAVTSDIITNNILGRSEYGSDDFIPIIRAHVDVGMIHVSENSSYKTWDEFVKFGKENPKKLSVGGFGAASYDEVVLTTIFNQAGIEVNYVPFEEAGQMHAALLGGHIDAMYEEPSPAMSLIEGGNIKPILTTAEERLENFDDVPTVREFGYEAPPYMWRGIIVKKDTPQEIVEILEEAYKKAHESDDYQNFEEERMLNLMPGYMDSETFANDIEREYGIYSTVLKNMGY